MDLTIFVLVVSSFSSFGILGLWAVASTRHWFQRSSVYLGFLSLLSLISTWELFLLFAVQGFCILWTILAWRIKREGRPDLPRFSLADILLITSLVAFVILIVRSFPSDMTGFGPSHSGIAILGVVAAANVLLAHWWTETSRSFWRKIRTSFLLILVIASFGNWFGLDLTMSLSLSSWGNDYRNCWGSWFEVTVVVFLVVLVFKTVSQIRRWKKWFVGGGTFLLSLPSVYCFCLLMTPLPIPNSVASENGSFQKLVEAGAATDCIEFANWQVTPIDQLAIEINKRAEAFKQAEEALRLDPAIPLRYVWNDFYTASRGEKRMLARAFCARARWRLATGEIGDAMEDQLRVLEIGRTARKGGVQGDWLNGLLIDQLGRQAIHDQREKLDAQQCQYILRRVKEIRASHEPLAAIKYRDRVWRERALGGLGHLSVIIQDGAFDPSAPDGPITIFARTRHRLFMTSIAIRGYSDMHGRLPSSLDQLAPAFLSEVPIDPFDPDGYAFRYTHNDGQFALYSVGENGIDECGVSTKLGSFKSIEPDDLSSSKEFLGPSKTPARATGKVNARIRLQSELPHSIMPPSIP